MVIYSFIFGPIILCLLYALCFFLVVGVKVVIYLFSKPSKPLTQLAPTPPKKPREKRKSVKSIEIDPDFIDRIYVKKSS